MPSAQLERINAMKRNDARQRIEDSELLQDLCDNETYYDPFTKG